MLTAGRTDLPEPDDLLAGARVVAVDGVPLPVVHVHLLHAAQHQLQLALVEVLQPLERYNLRDKTIIHFLGQPICGQTN